VRVSVLVIANCLALAGVLVSHLFTSGATLELRLIAVRRFLLRRAGREVEGSERGEDVESRGVVVVLDDESRRDRT
jgi:hypothetical protein